MLLLLKLSSSRELPPTASLPSASTRVFPVPLSPPSSRTTST